MRLYTIKPLVWTNYDRLSGTKDCWASGISCVEYSIQYYGDNMCDDYMVLSMYEQGELTYQSEYVNNIYALQQEANNHHRIKLYRHIYPKPGCPYFYIKPLLFEENGSGNLEAKGLGGDSYEGLIYTIEHLDEETYTLTILSRGFSNEEIAGCLSVATKKELLEIANQFNEKIVAEYLTEVEVCTTF